MKLKELKVKLNEMPENMDEAEVIFGAQGVEGLYVVDTVKSGKFAGETPEGCATDMVLLWNGEMK